MDYDTWKAHHGNPCVHDDTEPEPEPEPEPTCDDCGDGLYTDAMGVRLCLTCLDLPAPPDTCTCGECAWVDHCGWQCLDCGGRCAECGEAAGLFSKTCERCHALDD